MNDPRGPLPLHEVLGIVERRRRRRARVVAVAGPAVAVAAAGVAGLIVVAIQSGPPASAPAAAAPSTSAVAPPTEPGSRTSAPSRELDPGYVRPGFVEDLADALPALEAETGTTGTGTTGTEPRLAEARTLAAAWEVTQYPAAKAILVKASLTGTVLDPDDPAGADELADRFTRAGYTEEYAGVLAEVWGTDARTAQIIGALVVAIGE